MTGKCLGLLLLSESVWGGSSNYKSSNWIGFNFGTGIFKMPC